MPLGWTRGVRLGSTLGFLLMLASARGSFASEIWVPSTSQQDLGGLEVASNTFWPTTPLGAVRLALAIPGDLQAFQSAKIVMIPGSPAGAATLNLFVCASQGGHVVTESCGGPFTQAFTGIANQLVEVEVGPLIASRIGAPGVTYLALLAYTTPTTSSDHVLGMRVQYAPKAPAGVATLAANTFTGTQQAPAFVGDGSGLTNVRPSEGSLFYIQNKTTPQGASFNIGGTGQAALLGVGIAPSFGLDVNAELVAYGDISFRDTGHRWRLRSSSLGLEAFQVFNHNNALVNQTRLTLADNGNVGIATTAPAFPLDVNGDARVSSLSINNYAANNGGPALCANTTTNRIAICTSSLRYKTDVQPFAGGLDIVTRLRPIRFTWTDGGAHDIGFGAEEVDRVEPLLAFRNGQGSVEGVKYGQMSVVFVNAIQEQQAEIDRQRAELRQQRERIDALEQQLRQLLSTPSSR